MFHFDKLKGLPNCRNARSVDLNGAYFSISQSIQLQLSTKSIRQCMQFRQMHDVQSPYRRQMNHRFVVFDYGVIFKLCTDGFSLKGGRPIQLGTLTNVSIPGAENSIEASDIQYMADIPEDRFSRSLVQQTSECEIDLLRRVGMVDLSTGESIYPIFVQAEDSKSLQLCLGRGGPRSKSRLIFSRISADELCSKWKTLFTPICFDAHGAHSRWLHFFDETLVPKLLNTRRWRHLKAGLVPFTKTKSCPEINRHRQKYEEAYAWMLTALHNAGLQNTDWLCAESIRAKNYAPLHGSLRVPMHCLKWYHLYILEYNEWIELPANSDLKFANHSRRFQARSASFVLRHIRDCLDIPFGYDVKSPSKSRIAAEGGWRRKLWSHLHDVVFCSKCGFRPWEGSPLESYFAIFWVTLVEIMLPTEILHFSNYDEYFHRYLNQKFIRNASGELKYETASVWTIYSKQWFVLFMKLFGNWRMTRYVHGLVYCTQHGFELAQSMQVSFRGTFGEDIVERMNGSAKGTILGQTPRFGGKYKFIKEDTVIHAMKVQSWTRYKLREESPRLRISARQQKYLVANQKKRDRKNMALPNELRKEFHRKGISLQIKCPLSNQFQRRNVYIRRARKHRDYISFRDEDILESSDVSDEEDLDIRFDENEEKRSNLHAHLHGILDVIQDEEDEIELHSHENVLEDSDSGADEEYDCDVNAALSRKFTHLLSVAFAGPRTEIVRSNIPQQERQFEIDGITWTPFKLKLHGSEWLFGRSWMRLTTYVARGQPARWIKYKLSWNYKLLSKITMHRNGSAYGILMKMAGPPKIEKLKSKRWVDTHLPTALRVLQLHGKISIWLSDEAVTEQSLIELITKYKYFTRFHQVEYNEYQRIPTAYSDAERRAAMNAYRGSRTPLLSLHSVLVDDIEKILKFMRLGGQYKCASCMDEYGWFERHSICMDGGEEVHNISQNLLDKLLWGNYTESNCDLRIVPDPAEDTNSQNGPSIPQSVIAEDPVLWGAFLHTIHMFCVEFLKNERHDAFMNCRVDCDWAKMTIPVRDWLRLLDKSMCHVLEVQGAKRVEGKSNEEYIESIFQVVSRLFIIPIDFSQYLGSADALLNTTRDDRDDLYGDPNFAVRFRHHYIQGSAAHATELIFMMTELWEEIGDDVPEFKWSFHHSFIPANF